MAEFKAGGLGPHMTFSQNLISCAYSELYLSLEERRGGVYRLKDNHYSSHAVGSIVLLVTGFDSFLNEGLSSIGTGPLFKSVLELASEPTIEKYYGTIQELGGTIQRNNNLDSIIKLRDEIVHYFPRNVSAKGSRRYLPQTLYGLDKKGLFFRFPENEDYEMPFGELVSSYRLAYWVWENIELAVCDFISAFSSTKVPEWHFIYSDLHDNFKNYQKITSPNNLATYDASNELELTCKGIDAGR
jgi:hypothetical protein